MKNYALASGCVRSAAAGMFADVLLSAGVNSSMINSHQTVTLEHNLIFAANLHSSPPATTSIGTVMATAGSQTHNTPRVRSTCVSRVRTCPQAHNAMTLQIFNFNDQFPKLVIRNIYIVNICLSAHSELPGIIYSRSSPGPGHFSLDMGYLSYVC